MHNIKYIRDDIDDFNQLISKRNINLKKEIIIDLDQENRKLIQKKENLEKEKKEISKTKDKSLFDKSKKISIEIDKVILLQTETKKKTR